MSGPSRDRNKETLNRRGFLASAAVGTVAAARSVADDANPRSRARAIAGDPIDPKWEEKLTLVVGPQGGDIAGTTEKAIQAAVDAVARLGGGTVRLLPGRYVLRNAVYLASRVRLVGAGRETILVKAPSVSSKLAADSDWFDQEITLANPAGFRVGDGVCLRTKNPHNGGVDVAKRTLVARSGARFRLDKALRQNFWQMGETTVSTLFPILSGELVRGVTIESLTLDGDRGANENLDGNYAGCVFLQDCGKFLIKDVEARNYNGDGISWQICHDVVVENCHSHDNAGLGLHPGSGSQRPVIRGNRVERNDIGLFVCWGVRFGKMENNVIRDNRSHGVSIGHRDTDNLIANNEIIGSGKVGILFRPERGPAFAPHRNLFRGNRVADTGPEGAVAVDVGGATEGVRLVGNRIEESRGPMKRIAIRVSKETRDLELSNNAIKGFAVEIDDLRKPS